jgi:energy-converting hydrogenase Eha subunit A
MTKDNKEMMLVMENDTPPASFPALLIAVVLRIDRLDQQNPLSFSFYYTIIWPECILYLVAGYKKRGIS